jgi:serine phosphatase RsbU (regulator of sigma subunit)
MNPFSDKLKHILVIILALFLGSAMAQHHKELIKQADLFYEQNQFEKAGEIYERAFLNDDETPKDPTSLYNSACSFALAGNKEKAIGNLYRAVGNGYRDFDLIVKDKDLENIRVEQGWDTLLARLYEKAGIIHAEVQNPFFYKAALLWAKSSNNENAFRDLDLSIRSGGMKLEILQSQEEFIPFHGEARWQRLVLDAKRQEKSERSNFYWGVYFGILVFLFAFNFFMVFFIKEWSFLYFALFLLSYFHFEAMRTNAVEFYFGDIFVWLKYIKPKGSLGLFFMVVNTGLLLLFVKSFLNLKQLAPKINKSVKIVLIIFALVIIASFYVRVLQREIIYCLVLVILLFSLCLGIYTLLKGFRPARFFTLGMVGMTFTVFWAILASFHLVERAANTGVFHIDNLGTAFFSVIFSLAIGDKVSILKVEKETAQEKALEVLEEKVQERTLEIIEQKRIVEEKQKEIIESITYAKRLQEAILPPRAFLNKNIPDNFVIYMPKDLVAGDFYWAEKINELFFIAAADSTGHGVPGAMVSVVCSNALNRAVKEFNLTETGKVLDKTRELVLETFEKSANEVKDGMDISLLCIDKKNGSVFWSGANNPLWYFEDGELKEIKADKQPIGMTEYPRPFTTHRIEYKENNTFYLFTDGLPDQFGGPNGKKFKYKQFSELLVSLSRIPIKDQGPLINKAFEEWKGPLEQVDDVCVIGVRV